MPDSEGAARSETTSTPRLPLLLRRSGETRALQTPLTVDEVNERMGLYLGAGKRRQELARVQGRTIVARRVGAGTQFSSYRRYLLGVQATALCLPHATPDGTLVMATFSTVRYRRIYTVGALLALIIGIFIFAPPTALWMRSLLAFGILLVMSNWRLSRPTRETREETRWLIEFVRNLLDARDVSPPSRRPAEERVAVAATRGSSD